MPRASRATVKVSFSVKPGVLYRTAEVKKLRLMVVQTQETVKVLSDKLEALVSD